MILKLPCSSLLASLLLSVVFVVVIDKYQRKYKEEYVPPALRPYVRHPPSYCVHEPVPTAHQAAELRSRLRLRNAERTVVHMHRFGPVTADEDMVVVRAGRDLERLQYLVASLALCTLVQDVLLVFSHNYYSDDVDRLVQSIQFARFMQIYYPYSVQANPGRFPGVESDSEVGRSNVTLRGRRDALLAEHKHHWWWTAHFVFSNMEWSSKFQGTVIFLEEDSFVLPDLLHMLHYAKRARASFGGGRIVSFGRPPAAGLDYDLLMVDVWRPFYATGLALDKATWEGISSKSVEFCTYDDESWSYSLGKVISSLDARRSDVVVCVAPRVISTGLHASGRAAVQHIHWRTRRAALFPAHVRVVALYGTRGRIDALNTHPPRGNGGWTDQRDHRMCLDMLVGGASLTTSLDSGDTSDKSN